MIVYSLKCAREHNFEVWFRDSSSYEQQVARRAVACPECGSSKVSKAPMAPRLSRGAAMEAEPAAAQAQEPRASPTAPEGAAMMARRSLEALQRQVEASCEYVGERFPEEARKIHYGEAKRRDIYGEAKDDEAKALAEEGVEFHRIPWIRRGHS